jgi:hypothetical protein
MAEVSILPSAVDDSPPGPSFWDRLFGKKDDAK